MKGKTETVSQVTDEEFNRQFGLFEECVKLEALLGKLGNIAQNEDRQESGERYEHVVCIRLGEEEGYLRSREEQNDGRGVSSDDTRLAVVKREDLVKLLRAALRHGNAQGTLESVNSYESMYRDLPAEPHFIGGKSYPGSVRVTISPKESLVEFQLSTPPSGYEIPRSGLACAPITYR